jgi:hypothetical protein
MRRWAISGFPFPIEAAARLDWEAIPNSLLTTRIIRSLPSVRCVRRAQWQKTVSRSQIVEYPLDEQEEKNGAEMLNRAKQH